MQPATIDLTGLPEPVAQGIAKLVEALRQGQGEPKPGPPAAAELPRWEGVVLTTLSRRELYDDAG